MWKKKKNDNFRQGSESTTTSTMSTSEYSRTEQSFTSSVRHVTTSVSSSTSERTGSISTTTGSITNRHRNHQLLSSASVKSLTDVTRPSRSIFEIDAKPFVNSTVPSGNVSGYKSTFTRQLEPFGSNREITGVTPSYRTIPRTQSLPCPPKNSTEIPTYDTNNGRKRGKVMVINNVNFMNNKDDRDGALKDDESVSSLFKSMGFSVKVHRNLKKQEMVDKIKKFRSDKDLKQVDISIVILMSHGNNVRDQTVIPGGYTEISGTDGKGLSIDEVLNEFDTEKCSGMKGKPKLFFFQCCRGEGKETLQTDAKPIGGVVRRHADMLVAYSTLPGFYSLRDSQKGSWYIQSICEIFKVHARNHDVETMLKMVDYDLSKKHSEYTQTTNYENRGFKRCFLNPIG